MASSTAVRTRRLDKQFSPGVGVDGIDLEVDTGTIFGFIGPSGSGKTTTIRLLTGVTAPDAGEVTVLGKAPASFNRGDRARLGYMPQLSVLYDQSRLAEDFHEVLPQEGPSSNHSPLHASTVSGLDSCSKRLISSTNTSWKGGRYGSIDWIVMSC